MDRLKKFLQVIAVPLAAIAFALGFELGKSVWVSDLNDIAMSDQVFVQAVLSFKDLQRLESGSTVELRRSLNRALDSKLSMLTTVDDKSRILESCFLARVAEFRETYPYSDQGQHITKMLSQSLPKDEACQCCDEE